MSANRLPRDLAFSDYHVRKDPGTGYVLHADMSQVTYSLVNSSTAAETRTLATPERAGILISIAYYSGTGTITISGADSENFFDGPVSESSIVLSAAGDCVSLVSVRTNSDMQWMVIGRSIATPTTYSRDQVVKKVTVNVPDTTSTTAAIVSLSTGDILHNVIAVVKTELSGTGTATLEVGTASNPDKYIDSSDYNESTADAQASMLNGTNNDQKTMEVATTGIDIIAKGINNGGTPTKTGVVDVYAIYTPGLQ